MNPSESTPADNTRRRTAARSRTGSDSSVESEPLDATLVHRSNPERHHRTGAPDSLTTASSSSVEHTTGSKPFRLLEDRFVSGGASRTQAPPNPDPILAAFLQLESRHSTSIGARIADQIKIQSVEFTAQAGALSDRVEAVIDRLNRLERERENRDGTPTPHRSRASHRSPTFHRSQTPIDRAQCTEHSKSRGIESRTFRPPTYLETE